LDIKVEHQEGHSAQITVQVEPEQTQASKQKAARKLAQKLRIPGFRPGKAPYNVIVQMVGNDAILEEAMEDIGNSVYSAALAESQIEPAAPGAITDIKEEDGKLHITFNVPKAPEVEVGDYRAIREALEVEPVTDDVLNKALETLLESRAVIEDVQRAAKLGDEVELDLKVTWWHEGDHDHDHGHEEDENDEAGELEVSDEVAEAAEEEASAEEEAAHDHEHDHEHHHEHDHEHTHDHEHDHGHEHVLIDDRNAKVVMRPEADERDMLPGFSAQVMGLSVGEEKTFELELPEDFEDESLRGQTVDVELKVSAVRSRTLPEMNDTFAASATNGEQQTLLELRVKTREDLEKASREVAESNLFDKVFKQIMENASFQYHEVTVRAYATLLLRNLDAMLRERLNMGLRDYLRIMNQTEDQLIADRREDALQQMKRDLVLSKLTAQEQLSVTDEAIDAEIDRVVASFGEQAAQFRHLVDTPEGREDIASRLMSSALVKRVVDISTGQEVPSLEQPVEQPEQSETSPESMGE
jgi:trigger factor